jgi:uncharacterized membrane protein YccC
MRQRRQHRAWKAIAFALVVSLLLLVLLPHSHQPGGAMAGPLLATVFLFGVILIPKSLWQATEVQTPQSPNLPSRFQRPPPALT